MSKLFGKTTYFSVPDSIVNSIDDGLVHYMADIWHGFFKYYKIKSKNTVIEVAPGTSAKIGLALEKCQFEGKLFVIEPSKLAGKIIKEKYERFLPKADLRFFDCSLAEALEELPQQPDFLVSNHPLDDMLLSTISENFTSDLFNCHSSIHKKTFFELKTTPAQPILSVSCCWQKVIDQLEPKSTIISQYPSLTLKQNDLQLLNEYATEVMKNLKNHYNNVSEFPEKMQMLLNKYENFNDMHLGTEVLNSKNWMILRSCLI